MSENANRWRPFTDRELRCLFAMLGDTADDPEMADRLHYEVEAELASRKGIADDPR